MPLEVIIPYVTKNFVDLTEKVQVMVAERLNKNMLEAYNVRGIVKEYLQVLRQVNPQVSFYIDGQNKTHRIIDTKDHKLAKILGSNLAQFAKFNPELMDRVLTQIINR